MATTATITGTIAHNISPLGPSASLNLGAPLVGPTSATGPTLSFSEKVSLSLYCATGSPTTIPFGTLADADVLYIGTDQAAALKLDSSATAIPLAAGGFVLIYKGSVSSATIEPTVLAANVVVLGLGD
jgi:hypothetical protein